MKKCTVKKELPKEKLKLGDQWHYKDQVCEILKVTKLTLWNYRDNFILPTPKSDEKFTIKNPKSKLFSKKNFVSLDPLNTGILWIRLGAEATYNK